MSGPARVFLVQGQYLDHTFFTKRKDADEHAKWMRKDTGYKHWIVIPYVPAKKPGQRQGDGK